MQLCDVDGMKEGRCEGKIQTLKVGAVATRVCCCCCYGSGDESLRMSGRYGHILRQTAIAEIRLGAMIRLRVRPSNHYGRSQGWSKVVT
jgi:hypothetical protein